MISRRNLIQSFSSLPFLTLLNKETKAQMSSNADIPKVSSNADISTEQKRSGITTGFLNLDKALGISEQGLSRGQITAWMGNGFTSFASSVAANAIKFGSSKRVQYYYSHSNPKEIVSNGRWLMGEKWIWTGLIRFSKTKDLKPDLKSFSKEMIGFRPDLIIVDDVDVYIPANDHYHSASFNRYSFFYMLWALAKEYDCPLIVGVPENRGQGWKYIASLILRQHFISPSNRHEKLRRVEVLKNCYGKTGIFDT